MQVLVDGTKQADSQPQIEREARRHMPVILEIGFEDLIAQVVLGLATGLLEAADVPGQHIREGVTGTAGETDVESVSYTYLRAHETRHDLVCRLLLEKK